MKKTLLYAILFATVSLALASEPTQKPACSAETPAQAVELLKAGNERFVSERHSNDKRGLARVNELTSGQAPFAAVVACSDSRVPVELLFDQGFGEIFVIRTAGNAVIGDVVQGSVDYAVNHLNVKVVMILGHTSCGAITGVCSCEEEHDDDEEDCDGKVPALLGLIGDEMPQYKGHPEQLRDAIYENVHNQVKKLRTLTNIKSSIDRGSLVVMSAVYDISNGRVDFEGI